MFTRPFISVRINIYLYDYIGLYVSLFRIWFLIIFNLFFIYGTRTPGPIRLAGKKESYGLNLTWKPNTSLNQF